MMLFDLSYDILYRTLRFIISTRQCNSRNNNNGMQPNKQRCVQTTKNVSRQG